MDLDVGRNQINKIAKDGETDLTRAVYYGRPRKVKFYLTHGADVNTKNAKGQTPLIKIVIAADDSDLDSKRLSSVIKQLLSCKEIDINVADKDGITALMHAVNGFYDPFMYCFKLLLERKDLAINQVDDSGQTVLFYALAKNNIMALSMLLAREDVDVNIKNKKGDTPLMEAVKSFKRRSLNDYDIDAIEDVSLREWAEAAKNGCDGLHLLLERPDIHINTVDIDGYSALAWAVKRKKIEAAVLLLTRDDIEVGVFTYGSTWLARALAFGEKFVTGLLSFKQYTREKLNQELEDIKNNVIQSNDQETLNNIIACIESAWTKAEKRNKSKASRKQKTIALIAACKSGDLKKVRALLSNGASVNGMYIDYEGEYTFNTDEFDDGIEDNPLHIAIEYNNADLVKLLLSYGANVYVLGEGNVNALNRAVFCGNFEIVAAALKHKQHVDARTRQRMRTNPERFEESCRELMLSEEVLIDADTAEDIRVQIKACIAQDDDLKKYEQILGLLIDTARFIEWYTDLSGGNADDKIEYMAIQLGGVKIRYMYLYNWSYGDSIIHMQYDDQRIESLQQSDVFVDEALHGLAIKLGLGEMPLAVFNKFITRVLSRMLHKQYISFDGHGMSFRVNSNAD